MTEMRKKKQEPANILCLVCGRT